MKTAWGEIKNQLKTRVPENTFSLWIKPIECLQAKKGAVVLGCPNRFSKDWVVENYLDLIEEKFNAMADGPHGYSVQGTASRKDAGPCFSASRPGPADPSGYA